MTLCWEIPPTSGLPPTFPDLFPSSETKNFCEALAPFVDGVATYLTCSGSAALYVAFEYLKSISTRRTVIVPAYSCPLVPIVAKKSGLKVVLCDVAAENLDFDFSQLENLIDNDTLCVIPTHYGGYLSDVEAVNALVKTKSSEIFVIEDAAQACGAVYDGKAVGTRGDIGFFSFAVGKGVTLFEGGAFTAKQPHLEALVRMAKRITPALPMMELKRSAELFAYHLFYRPRLLPFVYGIPLRRNLKRGDIISAIGDDFDFNIPVHTVGEWRQRVGARALKRLPQYLSASRQRYDFLVRELESVSGIRIFKNVPARSPSCIFLFVEFASAAQCTKALDALWREGLGVSKLFACALGEYDYLKSYLGEIHSPNAEKFAASTLTVSTSPFARTSDLEQIVDMLKNAARN